MHTLSLLYNIYFNLMFIKDKYQYIFEYESKLMRPKTVRGQSLRYSFDRDNAVTMPLLKCNSSDDSVNDQ